MKKNSEFVGVDDKFIPENEKYVDDSKIENKEESKKIAKRIGIGYLCLIGFVIIMILGGIFLAITMIGRGSGFFRKTKNVIVQQMPNMMNTFTNSIEKQEPAMGNFIIESSNSMFDEYEKNEVNEEVIKTESEYNDKATDMQAEYNNKVNEMKSIVESKGTEQQQQLLDSVIQQQQQILQQMQ